MEKAAVRPKHHVNYSTELMTSVRGVHGFEGYCSCGWTGLTWKTQSEANAEARWHFWIEHSNEDAARRREDVQATASAESS